MRRPLLIVLLLTVLLLTAATAAVAGDGAPASQPATRPAGMHPKAPPETAQFAFLIGEWDCTVRSMSPKGELGEPRKATWTAGWILGGWAIQDVWVAATLGDTSIGTNIRSWDPDRRKWNNRWLASGSLAWKHFDSEMQGDTMVMTGGEGSRGDRQWIDRNTFHSITDDRFEWRKDRSFDGGETWLEGVATIVAERAR